MGELRQKLTIRLLKDLHELDGFTCGIRLMDDFISRGFSNCVQSHLCTPYACYDEKETLVAFFALSFDALDLDSDDKDDLKEGYSQNTSSLPSGYDIFWEKSRYPALEITYLAVSATMQHKGIGYAVFDAIVDHARRQTVAGCQFITVNALHTKEYSAVDFYYKCGFSRYGNLAITSDIIPMFYTLYPDERSMDDDEF